MKRLSLGLSPRFHYGSPVSGYALAFIFVLLCGTARMALHGKGPVVAPFLFFYPAICLASFLGGTGPGLFVVLGGVAFGAAVLPVPPLPVSWIALTLTGPLLARGFAHLRELRERNHATALECARFGFIIDHASDWLLLTGENGEIEYVNRSASRQLGFEAAELSGRRLGEFVPENQKCLLAETLAKCQTGTPVTTELTFQRRNGSTVTVEAGYTAVKTGRETVLHVAARDITERREMEAKLREAQKWESLGVMAGGLAHDFNNLLTSILGNASLAREFLPPAHPAVSLLVALEQSGERSAELVRLMLATAGHRGKQTEKVPLATILTQTLAKRQLPHSVVLHTEVVGPEQCADHTLVSTLLDGLIWNAAEAYGSSSGEVRVRICAGPPPTLGPASFEEGRVASDHCLGIWVEDRGCGMTEDVLARAFDPFFSTKFMGRGLGLPAVRGLVRAYSGKLWLRTRPGEGTAVGVWLPNELLAEQRPVPALPGDGGREGGSPQE
jgi:two-component system cell cycle sensor histidine kinase/response regulator CckA